MSGPVGAVPAKPLHVCSGSGEVTAQLSFRGSHIASAVDEYRALKLIQPDASKPLRWKHLKALIDWHADDDLDAALLLT